VKTAPLPETDLSRISRYCADRVPARLRNMLRVEFETRGLTVTIIETRPPWQGGHETWARLKVAQLRYRPETTDWTLHCRNRNGDWYDYQDPFSGTASELLEEIDADPTGIFWG
jgi:Protein of unknown function (DUF3024)